MLSYIKSIINYLFSNNSIEEYDAEMENYLAEELLKIDLQKEDECDEISDVQATPSKSNCLERTGVITYINEDDGYVLIDGMLYFDMNACSIPLKLNDKVLYLCYKDSKESLVVVRILQNEGEFWGDTDAEVHENSYEIIEHVIIGEVASRDDRWVIIKHSDLKFNLDNVTATFVPMKGDLLEMMCKVKFDEDNPMAISSNSVLEVVSMQPLRRKVISSVITSWNGDIGTCGHQVFFNRHCNISNGDPHVGAKALIEVVESNQERCTWRVIKMDITENANTEKSITFVDDTEERSLKLEAQHKIQVTYPLKFENVQYKDKPQITLSISNKSDQQLTIYRWMLLCKRRDSQVNISPFLKAPKKLYPNETFYLTITCLPKFYGKSKEHMIITFGAFKVERLIEINILSDVILSNPSMGVNCGYQDEREKIEKLRKTRKNTDIFCMPGVQVIRPANFVAVRFGHFNVPEKVWSAVLGNSDTQISKYTQVLDRIESQFPCFLQNLNIQNYTDRWHALLYLEEVQAVLNIKDYDMPAAFLIKHQDYLCVEVERLSERRPSIILGDKVIVTDTWNDKAPKYTGFVHAIKGDLLLMKFHPRFHESYHGSDVAIEFHINRTSIRKAHHAINVAISKLGPDILFPSRITTRPSQIPLEKLQTIKWFNNKLNTNQKVAVSNILIGECRPMPYCIYGPPGTGKTVTVVEASLQILTLLPDSRILIATPSNSAANLITERLIEYRKLFSSSIIRLIANYMVDSENISDLIKPYCATLDIAKEETIQSKHIVQDGINMNVPSSYVGRYRVTIGTCNCLGSLAQVELPKGHYTHIIIDEAGQATEPELMIPMTLIDKESGQIIVAGDPKQLGPVVLSKYCSEYGMSESYLARIIQTFPYQKDFAAFKTGFNNKLITQLTDNYRSLEEVLTLPSEMFYDASLVAKIDRRAPFISNILDVVSGIYEMSDDPKRGGIFVHGVKGNNARAVDSPSWYNPQEASMVALTVCKLYRQNITPDELGIITPYIAQVKHLRRLFDQMNLQRPKIGTVEEFQGQERPLIIISTVRSSKSQVPEDLKHSLGFINSAKRINVALTRAQVAVLLFCDPDLLITDLCWRKVIKQAIKENKYMGCNLSFSDESNEQNTY